MTRRNSCAALFVGLAVAACGGSGTSATTIADDSVADAQTDPTPVQSGVDYTRLADFSGYDSWVCDNDTILDPATGTVLTPEVDIVEAPGALQRRVTSNSIPDHLVGDFPNAGNPNAIDDVSISYDITMRVATENPDTTSSNAAQLVGISLGGTLFDPMTAEVYNFDVTSENGDAGEVVFADVTSDLDIAAEQGGRVDHARILQTLQLDAAPGALHVNLADIAALVPELRVTIIDGSTGSRYRLRDPMLSQLVPMPRRTGG